MSAPKSYRALIWSFAALSFGLAAAAGTMLLTSTGPWQEGALPVAGRGFVRAAATAPDLPAVRFVDGFGRSRSLDEFKGKVVLLNFWATWCPPCVAEMPALARLQGALGGENIPVLTVSEDRGGAGVVVPFLEKLKIQGVGGYYDGDGSMTRALAAVGLPTTILIGRDGREIGRILGGAEWDAGPMRAVIEESVGGRKN